MPSNFYPDKVTHKKTIKVERRTTPVINAPKGAASTDCVTNMLGFELLYFLDTGNETCHLNDDERIKDTKKVGLGQ